MVEKNRSAKLVMLYTLLLLVFIFYASPIVWMITSSFKTDADALSMPPKWFFKPTGSNYFEAFFNRGLMDNFWNSLTISAVSSILALVIGTPAAYAMSRFRFRRKEDLFFWFLSTRMAPPVLAAIPMFILSRNIGIYDTVGLLIVMNMLVNLSWVVWMMRSFFDEIDVQIDESCMVDGCTRFSALWRIILPLSRPGLTATVIFCLILSWNEYFFALILTSVNATTLPAAISSFLTVHGLLWGQMCAAGTIIMLPIVIFVFFTQKQLVRGMTMGAVKG